MRLINFLLLLMSVLIACIVVKLELNRTKNPVVFFDMPKIKAQFIKQLANHKASTEQITKATLQFKARLHKVLENYSNTHKVIVLAKHLMLAGGQDVTEEIAYNLSHAMRPSL